MNKYPDAVHAILAIAQDNSLSTYARGKAFEDLACRLLEDLRGIEPPPMRNRLNKFGTEEIDLAVFNLRHPGGLRQLPEVFLVECKNWSSPTGSAEVSYFASRLRNRGCDLGILVSANGITGDPTTRTDAYFEGAIALSQGIRILVITADDIAKLTSDDDLISLLHRRFLCLYATGTFDLC